MKQRDLNKFLKDKNPWITFLFLIIIYPITITEDISINNFKESYNKFEDIISKFSIKK